MQATPKIEKGIPLPKGPCRHKGSGLVGLFPAMAVGDSIVLPASKRSYAFKLARDARIKIATRVDAATTTMRVWRVA